MNPKFADDDVIYSYCNMGQNVKAHALRRKASLTRGAIFLATCNAVLLIGVREGGAGGAAAPPIF